MNAQGDFGHWQYALVERVSDVGKTITKAAKARVAKVDMTTGPDNATDGRVDELSAGIGFAEIRFG